MILNRLPFAHWLHRALAVSTMGWVLLLGGLAVCPDWHEMICHHHEHAESSDDGGGDERADCIVTHYETGQLLGSFAVETGVCRALFGCAVPGVCRQDVHEPAVRGIRPPGRAPPVV